jgi:molecular chaperone HtpG
LEINPQHELIAALSRLGEADQAFREDAAQLLFDEAKIADGEVPTDVRAFSARLERLLPRAGLRGDQQAPAPLFCRP